jgi:hypothetical protein
MRRLLAALVLGAAAVLGLGSGLVVAGLKGTPDTGAIPICHSGNGKNFTAQSPDASGVLNGHAGHSYDIIPPFSAVNQDGSTTDYPGQNIDGIYGNGSTGAEVLANGCEVPPEPPTTTETTETITPTLPTTITTTTTTPPEPPTVTTITTETVVTETVTVPATTVTVPGGTTTVTIPAGDTTTVTTPPNTVTLPAATVTTPGETVTNPAQTVTVPGTTTVVTAPAAQTTTVTIAPQTVTMPATTVTTNGGTTTNPAQTVTVPGTTTRVTVAGTTKVMTVTTPSTRLVRGGVLASKIHLALKVHHRIALARAARVLRLVIRHLQPQRVIVVILRPHGCPAGTKLFKGRCAPIVHGSG